MKTRGNLLMASCVGALLCMPSAAMAQTPTPPVKGTAAMNSVTVTATVTAIDQKTRAVSIKTTDGKEYSFIAGDDVKNLSQVAVGDVVTATYTEALLYEVKSGGTTGASQTMATERAGADKPGGVIGQKTTVTVVITAIDSATPSVTFKGPAGNVRTIKVQQPEKLKGVKVGDTVDITYVESVAVSVEKGKK